MTALMDIEVALVKFKQKGGGPYPIGEGKPTKNGTGFALEVYPGQQIRGNFYLFPKDQKGGLPEKEPEYKSAADEYGL
ncbi:MAG: hypothetical protein ACE5FY_08085 [Nitrospiria bacterium]